MARHRECEIPCPSEYDKLITFLRPPDELNADQEIEARDWIDWTTAGKAYASIKTRGSRAVNIANQSHQSIDAVIECAWNGTTRIVSDAYAIRLKAPDNQYTYLHVVAATNVNYANTKMQFLCRETNPTGIQDP